MILIWPGGTAALTSGITVMVAGPALEGVRCSLHVEPATYAYEPIISRQPRQQQQQQQLTYGFEIGCSAATFSWLACASSCTENSTSPMKSSLAKSLSCSHIHTEAFIRGDSAGDRVPVLSFVRVWSHYRTNSLSKMFVVGGSTLVECLRESVSNPPSPHNIG